MKAIRVVSELVGQERVSADVYRMVLHAGQIARTAWPGQFVHLRVEQGYDPLLRRPFSVHRVNREEGTFEILYRVVGRGTWILSTKAPGQKLDLIGPLGRGFAAEGGLRTALVVAGGMGVAPLVFLTDVLREELERVEVFLGAENEGLVVCARELESYGAMVHIATEDGSRGFAGQVTELLAHFLGHGGHAPEPTQIYTCGPKVMLAQVAALAEKFSIPCQVSLEEVMACGVGACLGCAVKCPTLAGGYKLACVDGPVFDTKEVVLG